MSLGSKSFANLRRFLTSTLVALALTGGHSTDSYAAEGGSGAYLLGFRGSLAGFLPPPGTYLQNDKFYYHGEAQASRSFNASVANFPIAGLLVAGVEADVLLDVYTGIWVPKTKVLGGNLALSALVPVGWVDVTANVGLGIAGPNNTLALTASRTDDVLGIGDLFLSAAVGWHKANWHWNVAGGVVAPTGEYEVGRLSNIGKNHWAFDLTVPITWLNPKNGLEFTVAPGLMFNAENPDTNYETGTEFHLEFAAMKNISKKAAFGITGYHYKQLTGDSGSGARLGEFKGQVTAIGPNLKLNLNVGKLPVSVSARWMTEFNVKRRLEGDSGFVTVSIPLGLRKR